uniref:Uncharacterized protein n=1 Tax=Arundo donax TaxID=35708 RepID=A0A0A9EYW3_ARUDO
MCHNAPGTSPRPRHPLQLNLLKTRADLYTIALVVAYVVQEGSPALPLCFPPLERPCSCFSAIGISSLATYGLFKAFL